jgi:small nuclear ribonucleoprotein (snRNP)-like protein
MSLLRSFHSRHVRVFLSIRASHTLRSIVSGFLLAFDKHWNMVVGDVDEEYTEWEWHKYGRHTADKLRAQGARWIIPKGSRKAVARMHQAESTAAGGDHTATVDTSSASAPAAAVSTSSAAPLIKVEVRKRRHLHQLYIRGDSVVSVTQHLPTLLRPAHEESHVLAAIAHAAAAGDAEPAASGIQ